MSLGLYPSPGRNCPSFSKMGRDQKQERTGTDWLVVLLMKRVEEEQGEMQMRGKRERNSANKRASKVNLLLILMSPENQESHRNKEKKVMKHFK